MGLFRRGKHEKRDWLSDSWALPLRTPYFSTSGVYVDSAQTLGIATASACLRLVSETIGMMPLKVYSGEAPNVTPARDSWQWYRLKEAPNDTTSAFDFWQDAAASVESAGNAWIWKAMARRPIQDENDFQMFLIDPTAITTRRDEQGRRYYEVRRDGKIERIPASQILHIRGWTATPGADLGMSPIALHRETLGNAIAARDYSSSFYRNGVTAAWGIKVPGQPTQDALDRLSIEAAQRHAGLSNAFKPWVLINEAEPFSVGISMKDAQYIETQGFSAEEVCRVFRVWPRMLGLLLAGGQPAEDDFERFMKVDLAPRITRIEGALMRDPDLFPSSSGLFPRFYTDAVLRPSLQSRSAAYKDSLQAGWKTANEVRETEDLPPLPEGDTLQQTPVGGAPNLNGKANVPSNA